MLRVMRDPRLARARRDDMAKAAAQYVHAKRQAVHVTLQANMDGSTTFAWLPADKNDGDDTGDIGSFGLCRAYVTWDSPETGRTGRGGVKPKRVPLMAKMCHPVEAAARGERRR